MNYFYDINRGHRTFLAPLLAFSFAFYMLIGIVLSLSHKTNLPGFAATLTSDLYVSAGGTDSNPCSQAAPCATIEKADSLSVPGTTVHVLPGTYTWNGVLVTHSGTATARITYESDTKWGAKLVPASVSSHSSNDIFHAKGDYVDITGFDVEGPPGGGGTVNGIGTISNGIGIEGSYDRVTGNRVHDIDPNNTDCNIGGGNGIYTWGYYSHDNNISGNLIYNISYPSSIACAENHGIYTEGTNGQISNNIVHHIGQGWGIHCWHSCSGWTIINNLTFDNSSGGIVYGGGDAPNFANSLCDNMLVANNISINNTLTTIGVGIHDYEYPGENTLGTHNQILNNITYGNPWGNINLYQLNTVISGTITADAQFVNYQQDGSGDYHLSSTSPAVDAGISTGAPATDFDGNTRPQGSGFDIGAYEFKPPVSGDCNGDGHVTIIDLSLLLSHFGQTYGACDFNGDGSITILDLSILLSHYGT